MAETLAVETPGSGLSPLNVAYLQDTNEIFAGPQLELP